MKSASIIRVPSALKWACALGLASFTLQPSAFAQDYEDLPLDSGSDIPLAPAAPRASSKKTNANSNSMSAAPTTSAGGSDIDTGIPASALESDPPPVEAAAPTSGKPAPGYVPNPNSVQPFIDSLLSGLPPEESSVGYTDRIKAGLKPNNSVGYTERMKQQIGPEAAGASSKGYTENLQRKLGPKPGGNSAIADLQSNKQLKADMGDPYVRSAFSLRLAGNLNREYSTRGDASTDQYRKIYGTDWVPEVNFTYEWRPLATTPGMGGLAVQFAMGFSNVTGEGTYQFIREPFGEKSGTGVHLVTIPLTVGPMVHFNAFKYVAPYAGLGLGVMGFYEGRSDDGKAKRGYSGLYTFSLGVNISLDWLSARDAFVAYDTAKVKHTYLTVDYTRQQTLKGGLVDATVSGLSGGLLFEF